MLTAHSFFAHLIFDRRAPYSITHLHWVVLRTTARKVGNLNPAVSKTPEPMITKIGVGDKVGDPYSCTQFHYDSFRGFCSPATTCSSAYKVTWLVNFGEFFCRPTAKSPAQIFYDQCQMTLFHARMCFLEITKQTTFLPHFSPPPKN